MRRNGWTSPRSIRSAIDRRDRSDFLRFFYRRYKGAPVAQIDHHQYCAHLTPDRLNQIMTAMKSGDSLEDIDGVE